MNYMSIITLFDEYIIKYLQELMAKKFKFISFQYFLKYGHTFFLIIKYGHIKLRCRINIKLIII
jgi:hypothetical protein